MSSRSCANSGSSCACIALATGRTAQDAELPVISHVYAALKSGHISFDEMDELALQFAAYYGCAKADYLNQVIGEQKQRMLAENQTWPQPDA
jgi:4-carboxymuconolactone decarboxylase